MSMYNLKNPKSYMIGSSTREFGTSHSIIICPFCDEEFKAYWWSIAGTGKKCPKCGALHGNSGYAVPVTNFNYDKLKEKNR